MDLGADIPPMPLRKHPKASKHILTHFPGSWYYWNCSIVIYWNILKYKSQPPLAVCWRIFSLLGELNESAVAVCGSNDKGGTHLFPVIIEDWYTHIQYVCVSVNIYLFKYAALNQLDLSSCALASWTDLDLNYRYTYLTLMEQPMNTRSYIYSQQLLSCTSSFNTRHNKLFMSPFIIITAAFLPAVSCFCTLFIEVIWPDYLSSKASGYFLKYCDTHIQISSWTKPI